MGVQLHNYSHKKHMKSKRFLKLFCYKNPIRGFMTLRDCAAFSRSSAVYDSTSEAGRKRAVAGRARFVGREETELGDGPAGNMRPAGLLAIDC